MINKKMKATGLRCGNLIKDNGDRICIVEQINSRMETVKVSMISKGYEYESCRIDEINPIPLTEEWFLKFGFIKVFESRKGHEQGIYENRWIKIAFAENGCYTFNDSAHTSCIFKYVHQLQNLFFALTGEELPIESLWKKVN